MCPLLGGCGLPCDAPQHWFQPQELFWWECLNGGPGEARVQRPWVHHAICSISQPCGSGRVNFNHNGGKLVIKWYIHIIGKSIWARWRWNLLRWGLKSTHKTFQPWNLWVLVPRSVSYAITMLLSVLFHTNQDTYYHYYYYCLSRMQWFQGVMCTLSWGQGEPTARSPSSCLHLISQPLGKTMCMGPLSCWH